MGARLSWPPGWLLRGVWGCCGAVVVGNRLILFVGGLHYHFSAIQAVGGVTRVQHLLGVQPLPG